MLNFSVFYEIYNFVIERKKDDGGFGATVLLPATIEDTFYAIEILEILKNFVKNKDLYEPQKDKHLITWLGDKLREIEYFGNSPKILWYLCKIFSLTNLRYLEKFREAFLDIIIKNKKYLKILETGYLDKLFYIGKVCGFLSIKIDPILNTFFRFRTVKDLFMILWLSKNKFINWEYKKEKILNWLKNCQNFDGGFGFFPGTTSYLENTYFALKSYQLLNKIPENPYKILDFIFSCYVGKGGFARKPGGSSFLESTYFGVKSIKEIYKWNLTKNLFFIL